MRKIVFLILILCSLTFCSDESDGYPPVCKAICKRNALKQIEKCGGDRACSHKATQSMFHCAAKCDTLIGR